MCGEKFITPVRCYEHPYWVDITTLSNFCHLEVNLFTLYVKNSGGWQQCQLAPQVLIHPTIARLNTFDFMLANDIFLLEAKFGIINLKLIQRCLGWMSRRRPVSLLPKGGGLAVVEVGMTHT